MFPFFFFFAREQELVSKLRAVMNIVYIVLCISISGFHSNPLLAATSRAQQGSAAQHLNPACVVDKSLDSYVGYAGPEPRSLCTNIPIQCRCMCWELNGNGDRQRLLDVVVYQEVNCVERRPCYRASVGPGNCCDFQSIPCNNSGLWEGDCDGCGKASSDSRGVWSGCDAVIEPGPNSEYP
jgi:hypothetical protein